MNRTAQQRLRGKLGEAIPSGGSASETMFSDEEIEDFLEEGGGEVEAASYYGWVEKAGNYAALVSVNEGNASREMTELHRHAMRMVDLYRGYVPTPGRGRTQIGKIVRHKS